MFAWVSVLFSQLKLIIVGVALVGGTTVAVVVDQFVTTPTEPRSAEFAESHEVISNSDGDELLAEFAEECGPDAAPPDLTGLTEAQAEALVEPLIAACEEANEAAEEQNSAAEEGQEEDGNDDEGDAEEEDNGEED